MGTKEIYQAFKSQLFLDSRNFLSKIDGYIFAWIYYEKTISINRMWNDVDIVPCPNVQVPNDLVS